MSNNMLSRVRKFLDFPFNMAKRKWSKNRERPTLYHEFLEEELSDVEIQSCLSAEELSNEESPVEESPVQEHANGSHCLPVLMIEENSRETTDSSSSNCRTLRVEERCHIDRLPAEVLDIIMRSMSESDRMNIRAVCKSWYYRYNCNASLRFTLAALENKKDQKCLEHCGFRSMEITFFAVDFNLIRSSVWKEIGTRIQSLQLNYCRLGDRVVKNLILLCDNLRLLQLVIEKYDARYSFCRPETLEKLNVVREKLQTLKIYFKGCRFLLDQPQEYDSEMWERIFKALYRIFPNINHNKPNSIYHYYAQPIFRGRDYRTFRYHRV